MLIKVVETPGLLVPRLCAACFIRKSVPRIMTGRLFFSYFSTKSYTESELASSLGIWSGQLKRSLVALVWYRFLFCHSVN